MTKTYISVAMHGVQSSESSRIRYIAHLGYGRPELAKLHARSAGLPSGRMKPQNRSPYLNDWMSRQIGQF